MSFDVSGNSNPKTFSDDWLARRGPQGEVGDPMPGSRSGADGTMVRMAGEKFSASLGIDVNKIELLSPEGFNLIIGALDTGITKEQVKTGVEGIKLTEIQKADLARRIKEQIDLALKKAEEAKKAAEEKLVTNWIVAGLALLGAIALTVATAGAGAGVLAVAVVGAVGVGLAALNVADVACQQAGVTVTDVNGDTKRLDLSLGGMVDAIVAQQIHDGSIVEIRTNADNQVIDKNGNVISDPRLNRKAGVQYMTTSALQEYKTGWTIAANVIVAAAMIAAGAGGVSAASNLAKGGVKAGEAALKNANAASKAAGAFTQTSSTLERGGQGLAVAADLGQGAAGIYGGKKTQEIAEIDQDTARAKAEKKRYEAIMKAVIAGMGLHQDAIKTAMDRLAENYERLSSNVAAVNTNTQQISRINVS